jgi:hypothetical protein
VVERYSLNGNIQTGPFLMVDLGIYFRDIAYMDNEIWYAVDDSSEPVQVYTSGGTKTFSISSSIVPAAHGMTFDDGGYLWVADADADLIYKVDLDPQGTAGPGGAPLPETGLVPDANPFRGSVSIELLGLEGPADVRVIDTSGRVVARSTASGTFLWDGTDGNGGHVPAGAYVVMAEDADGRSASARVVRLR